VAHDRKISRQLVEVVLGMVKIDSKDHRIALDTLLPSSELKNSFDVKALSRARLSTALVGRQWLWRKLGARILSDPCKILQLTVR
jgi:hypothetical protein